MNEYSWLGLIVSILALTMNFMGYIPESSTQFLMVIGGIQIMGGLIIKEIRNLR